MEKTIPIYQDPTQYDSLVSYFKADIPFYIQQIKRFGDPVLELACGSGRVTIPLAQNNFQVSGLDLSPEMLVLAQKKAAQFPISIDWLQGDIRNFSLLKKFSVILFPFNSIGHLIEPNDLLDCLTCVRKHLTPQGVFIVDLFHPTANNLKWEKGIRYPFGVYLHPQNGRVLAVTESYQYDAIRRITHVNRFTMDPPKEYREEFDLKVFYPQEIEALFQTAGLILFEKYGDYQLGPMTDEAKRQLLLCRKAAE